jgi:hypothetical protein
MRARRSNAPLAAFASLAPIVALAVALVALAAWRASCVLAGPDQDTDAYAHHMIARAILADPRDLAVHWVWLPLFHYAQVPLVAVGGTMQDVRWVNVVLTAASPALVFLYVRRTTRPGWAATTALFAALVTAACPIVMQMGTTAQPEPLFALLVLAGAIDFQERRYGPAAAAMGAASLLRYEAWAAVAVIAAILAVDAWRRRKLELRAWMVVAAPVALVLAWAALRRPVDGRWFGFLADTKSFANDALHQNSAFDRGILALVHDLFYYALVVPVRVLGPAMPLVPFGVLRTLREQGTRFVLVLAACLGFISLTWVMRSSLGLDRHFVVVVPLYAIFAAQGAATLADGAARFARRLGGERAAVRASAAAAGVLVVGALTGLVVALSVWMRDWRGAIDHGWPDRRAVGDYLRALPGSPTVFCDEATVEILSGLDRRRFDRHWVDDPHTWDIVADDARRDGEAYVATWRRKLTGHESAGTIVFRAGAVEGDDSSGLAVMRVSVDEPEARH